MYENDTDVLDGFFDFTFDSYNDGIFTFLAKIKIDESLSVTNKTNMTNLYILDDLRLNEAYGIKQSGRVSINRYNEYTIYNKTDETPEENSNLYVYITESNSYVKYDTLSGDISSDSGKSQKDIYKNESLFDFCS